MDAMLTSFRSSTTAQLNNFIVYPGPPTAKNTCGTAIVAPGAAEAYMNVAADEYHVVEDSTTAGIDGGDLSAGRPGFPCDFSKWSGIDNDIRSQKGQTGIESASAHAMAPVGVLESTAQQPATQAEARLDTPAEDREHEFMAADLLAMDTSPGRGVCADFSATHATSKSTLRPFFNIVTPTERKEGDRDMFYMVDDDAMQAAKRRKQAGSHGPQNAAQVSDALRRPASPESSPLKGQDDVLPDGLDGRGDEPSDLGHSSTNFYCAPGNAEVDSSDDEIRPWKPRRHRRSIGSTPRGIRDTGCPKEHTRLSGASKGNSRQQRAPVPKKLPYELQPGPPADIEGRACSPCLPENADPSTTSGMDGSPGLGSSCGDKPQMGLERPARKDIAQRDCPSSEEIRHRHSKRKPARKHHRPKTLPRAIHSASVAYSYRSADSAPRSPQRRMRKQTRHGASLVGASDVQDQPRLRSPHRIEEEPTWAIEEIISSRRKHGRTFYQVKWKPT